MIGRFPSIDPFAEKYLSWNPYNYVGGNPIISIDPNGMDWVVKTDNDGNTHINVTVQVRNSANISKQEMSGYLDAIKLNFENLFKGSGENGTIQHLQLI